MGARVAATAGRDSTYSVRLAMLFAANHRWIAVLIAAFRFAAA